MQRLLSTYLFVSRKLTPETVSLIAESGFSGVEIFCSRGHFDYASKTDIQEIADALEKNRLKLCSLHAPTNRTTSVNRESGQPLSVCEVERVRRIDAMDEFKRALDVAERLPFARMIFHMGSSRETADARKRDAAFSTFEHLTLHARHLGVTICLENTASEMGQPEYLRAFVAETRLTGVRFNFDIGHANLAEGPEEERVSAGFAPLRELVAAVHLHDNHGEKDEHLLPYEGSIDWPAGMKVLKSVADGDLPLMLELKEKAGPGAPGAPEQLKAARSTMDRFEKEWEQTEAEVSR